MLRALPLAVLVSLLLLPPAFCQGNLSGNWEGQVIFHKGYQAKVQITLEEKEGDYTGTYTMQLLDQENAPQMKGRITARTQDGRIASLTLVADQTGMEITYAVKGNVVPAAPRANRAFYGSFESTGEGAKEYGVFMLWQGRGAVRRSGG